MIGVKHSLSWETGEASLEELDTKVVDQREHWGMEIKLIIRGFGQEKRNLRRNTHLSLE